MKFFKVVFLGSDFLLSFALLASLLSSFTSKTTGNVVVILLVIHLLSMFLGRYCYNISGLILWSYFLYLGIAIPDWHPFLIGIVFFSMDHYIVTRK